MCRNLYSATSRHRVTLSPHSHLHYFRPTLALTAAANKSRVHRRSNLNGLLTLPHQQNTFLLANYFFHLTILFYLVTLGSERSQVHKIRTSTLLNYVRTRHTSPGMITGIIYPFIIPTFFIYILDTSSGYLLLSFYLVTIYSLSILLLSYRYIFPTLPYTLLSVVSITPD